MANMTFHHLQLLFPLLVALHNTEEAISIPRWTRRSGPWFDGVQPAVFRFAVVVLTILAFVLTVLSRVSGKMTFWGNLTFGYIIAMLFNSLVPHIAVLGCEAHFNARSDHCRFVESADTLVSRCVSAETGLRFKPRCSRLFNRRTASLAADHFVTL